MTTGQVLVALLVGSPGWLVALALAYQLDRQRGRVSEALAAIAHLPTDGGRP